MPDDPDIVIRNPHGAVAGRISRAADGSLTVVVIDEESRWLVELAAERAGAPARPRPRPSCSPGHSPRSGAAPGAVRPNPQP